MNTILRSSVAEAQISSLGAELVSFKRTDTGLEYMWSGDAAYWTGRSPVLFPIIGAARGGEIRVEGQTYKIGNHGFARRREFTLVDSDGSRAVFLLTSDENTLASYPYKFNLFLTYVLSGSRIEISYRVENADEGDIFFQIGTHPAFNCPIGGAGEFSDYYLEFEQQENLERLFLNKTGQLIRGQADPLLQGENILPLNHEMFTGDALVFRNVASRQIALRSKLTSRSVVVTSEGLPDLGVWQPLNAPFLCIEPWQGVADYDDFTGSLKDKEGAVRLAPGEYHLSSLAIEIN
ncbi:aldose 1-epimerase family protein [Paenibacillus sp. MMS20-IR301]|uniref:aldose 1-epimerase family protein n=1 Tax=Paenibacillus sp. MMS20-IR301 TaxID=2895946 RepID=UPI0028E62A9D|nr:aldose 1-epimerase family protein [Paenibacillus sp. MMS20-IR301]WNS41978.1 aldose 1-epimerase family protein [Paenibacillus sp. MMS20-IR301]